MNNTAIGAKKKEITFKNESHREFYEKWLPKCRYEDVYHKALIYCLGISEDTRNHVEEIYDFKSGCVQTECLTSGWNTSGTVKVTIRDIEDLNRYEKEIKYNLKQSQEKIKRAVEKMDPFDFFQLMKFDKCVNEPLSGEPENMIEVVNQSMTYIVSLKAVEYLLKKYPGRSFTVNWGNIAGYDIESMDGKIICECFAATSYKSNGKLTADLKRLDKNDTAEEKYEFFYDREFKDSMKAYYEETYQGIKIIHFGNLDL